MATLITHEWLAKAGGSENVFEQMGLAFPEADQFCLWNEDPERFPSSHETWLGRTPLRRHKAVSLPFHRMAYRSIPLENYDMVIASSHAFGHYNAYRAVRHGARGFAYVHSPARYIWAPDHDARGQKLAVRATAPGMRWLDKSTTSDLVSYAANSDFVRRRVREAWAVDATVIHPPVAVDEIAAALATSMSEADAAVVATLPDDYVLGASRLIGYKRIDRVITLAAELGKPVVIAGEGPEKRDLADLADSLNVHSIFTGRVSDRLLFELYKRATLFVFLAIEDFGIMPLEAIAAGAPVLVNTTGGAWEGVRQTSAGTHADPTDLDQLRSAAIEATLLKANAGPSSVSSFRNAEFARRLRDWVGLSEK